MNITKLMLSILVIASLNACCAKKKEITTADVKKTSSEVTTTGPTTISTLDKMANDDKDKIVDVKDLSKGFVVYNKTKQGSCSTLIQVGDILLEPMRELPKEFLVDQQAVWIQYHPQRRMSRCGNTQPVEILYIKKRSE